MAKPTPKHLRRYSGIYLSDRAGQTLFLRCDKCGRRRKYNADAMLERLDEDLPLPELLDRIQIAEGCRLAIAWKWIYDDKCRLAFDLAAMDEACGPMFNS